MRYVSTSVFRGCDDGQLTVNCAAVCVNTAALGPGRRSVVWVQGCALSCPNCLAPDWIPQRPAHEIAVAELVSLLLSDPEITGLTFSGGEPMLQAGALAAVARRARSLRDVSVICFTGYPLARLRADPPSWGVAELLAQVDVLVDGPYIESRNTGRGLRGSDNQVVHHLTDRLADSAAEFEHGTRTAEIRIRGDGTATELLLVGVPPAGLRARLDRAEERISDLLGVDGER